MSGATTGRRWSMVVLALGACASASVAAPTPAPTTQPAARVGPEAYRRTAFLGDSITDGNTYPCLVRDALTAAGQPAMVAINAGIGGDTAAGMRARLDRDVLAFHPTLVTLSCGANDCFRPVPAAEYERDVRAIIDRLRERRIGLVLLTPSLLGPKQARGQAALAEYEAVLRKLAREYGVPLAEVNRCQAADQAAGHVQLAPDDLHPNYEGQRMIARAVLDAMGYADVAVPARVHNQPLPGVISLWRIRAATAGELPLTAARAAAVGADAGWLTIQLPETGPAPELDTPDDRWLDDYRQLGVSVAMRRREPKVSGFIAAATVHADRARTVQFHTGADLSAVWLNGHEVYRNASVRGWHPGRQSVEADLQAGDNAIVIETGSVFFLSMTDGPMWP